MVEPIPVRDDCNAVLFHLKTFPFQAFFLNLSFPFCNLKIFFVPLPAELRCPFSAQFSINSRSKFASVYARCQSMKFVIVSTGYTTSSLPRKNPLDCAMCVKQ